MSIYLMDERMLRIVYTTFTQLSDAYFMLLSIPVFFFFSTLIRGKVIYSDVCCVVENSI